jgi:TPR repeat protein
LILQLAAFAVVVSLLFQAVATAADPVPAELQTGLDLYAAKKWSKAFNALKPFADAGVPEALAPVGQMYLEGKGTARNEALGRDYLNKAAGADAASAKFTLGKYHLTESGQPDKGLAELTEAAAAGSVPAMELLGHAYRGYHDVAPDPAESLRWYRRAIEGGSKSAIIHYRVGMALVSGDGVGRDPVRGAQFLEVAANTGDLYAQTELAKLYASGTGVAVNPIEAEKLLADAVVKGHSPAMIPLGDIYLAKGEAAMAIGCYGAAYMSAHDTGDQHGMQEAMVRLAPFAGAGNLGAQVDSTRPGACKFEPSELFGAWVQDYFSGR